MSFRSERIERLLTELRYEIERGMMEGEIDENLTYQFFVPTSKAIKDGVVFCKFRTKPMERCTVYEFTEPKLRIVK